MKSRLIALYFILTHSALGAMDSDSTSNEWYQKKEHITQRILRGHLSFSQKVMFTPSGEKFISCSSDNSAKIWDTQSGVCLHTLKHAHPVGNATIYGDLVVTLTNNLASLWNINSGKLLRQYFNNTNFSCATFSRNGEYFVGNCQNGQSIKFEIDSVEKLFLGNHSDNIWDCKIAQNQSFILTGSSDTTIKQWNPFAHGCTQAYTEHTKSVHAIDLSDDDKEFSSASSDTTAKLWNINNQKSVRTFHGHTNHLIAVKLIKNKNILITASTDATAKIWDLNSGLCIHTLAGHTDHIRCIVLSNDGSMLVTGSNDHTIKLWDIQTGKCIATLIGHNSRINSLDISKDGKYIISASNDYNLILWNI